MLKFGLSKRNKSKSTVKKKTKTLFDSFFYAWVALSVRLGDHKNEDSKFFYYFDFLILRLVYW